MEFCFYSQWELLYADDLVIIAESLEVLLVKVETWMSRIKMKGVRLCLQSVSSHHRDRGTIQGVLLWLSFGAAGAAICR